VKRRLFAASLVALPTILEFLTNKIIGLRFDSLAG
jgi:hypothetical protein